MQAGSFSGGDVAALVSRVVVNGTQRSCVSWSISRDLPGELPDQILAVSGITQATGTVVWSEGEDVEGGGLNPWNPSTGWLPEKGDRVVIYEGDGKNEYVQFYGLIDNTTGSIGAGFQSTLIDDYDRLSATVSHEPLLRIMPPLTEGGDFRGVGLVYTYYVDLALRAGGYYVTPIQQPNTVLMVPCQGGMWPHAGTLTAGIGVESTSSNSYKYPAPWGWAVGDFSNKYAPRYKASAGDPVQLFFMLAPDHAGVFFFRVNYGSTQIQLSVGTNRTVVARVGGVEVARLTATQMSGAVRVSLLRKGNAWTLKNETDASASGTASLGSTQMGSVEVIGDPDARVAAFMVSHPSGSSMEHRPLTSDLNAIMDMSKTDLTGIMDAGRPVENMRADELLTDISQATLSGMWIDETGKFQWASSLSLRFRTPSEDLTTLNDVLSLDWEDSILGSRSKVTVTGRIPAISRGKISNKVLYRGSGESMASEEESEEFIKPEADTDWIMPDESMTVLNPLSWSYYNSGKGTFGGVFYSLGGETISADGLTMDITFSKVGISTYKLTHKAGVYSPDVTANLSTSPTATNLWPRNRDNALPVIRGYGKTDWTDTEETTITAGGVGPELVHEAGIWNNRSDDNQTLGRIAGYLAGQTAVPKPTISGLKVTPDPRRQLGDVVIIDSPDLMGVRIRALIVGRETSGDKDGHEESLTARFIQSQTVATTFAGYNQMIPGTQMTFQQWQALGPTNETFAELNTTI